jgi:phage terminase small subunit
MKTDTQITKVLTPRQGAYMQAFTDPESVSFGNSYQSAITAGYSEFTARNLSHLNPEWRSENIGQIATIRPEEIMKVLTEVIHDKNEPTIVRLKAIEMTMRAYSMLVPRKEPTSTVVTLNVDLTGG